MAGLDGIAEEANRRWSSDSDNRVSDETVIGGGVPGMGSGKRNLTRGWSTATRSARTVDTATWGAVRRDDKRESRDEG